MSNSRDSMADAAEIQRDAADWFAKRNGGRWSKQDEKRFDAWIAESRAHRIQYVRIESAWNHSARLQALGAGIPVGEIPPRRSWGDARYPRGNTEPPPQESVSPAATKEEGAR